MTKEEYNQALKELMESYDQKRAELMEVYHRDKQRRYVPEEDDRQIL